MRAGVLYELLRAQARRSPDRPAALSDRGALTYGELHRLATAVASGLRARGVRPGEPIGLCTERSFDLLAAVFGILEAGAACVPVDPDDPAERRRTILEHSDARLVLTDGSTAELAGIESVPVAELQAGPAAIADDPGGGDTPALSSDALAFLFYTSGSTGVPKGVMLSHEALLSGQRWLQRTFPLAPGDRQLLRTTLSVTNLVREVFWPVLAGGTMVLVPPGQHKDPDALVEIVNRFEVATLLVVPALLKGMLDNTEFHRNATLKYLFCSSDVMPGDLPARYFETGIRAELFNLYGLTEALYCSYWRCPRDAQYDGFVPVGVPAELTPRILDGGLRPVPNGTVGELCVSGVGIASGYYKLPELTLARFTADEHGRTYRTGDLAIQREDGCIELLERMDHQVKISGHRVELGEVERALEELPEVGQAVVVGRRGPGEHQRLIAYLTAAAGPAPRAAALRDCLARTLPDYMIPSAFLVLDAIPLTHNGKVDRKALLELRADALELAEDYVPPETALQRLFARLWAEVLDRQRVGLHDNFFALGGDSIQGFLISARARRAGIPLSATQVFTTPTVAELARFVEASGHVLQEAPASAEDGPDRHEPGPTSPLFPLTDMQKGMLFHSLLDPGSGVYFEQFLYTLRGQLDPARYHRAWQEVVNRHEILRCSVVFDGERQPMHRAHASAALECAIVDGASAEGDVAADLEAHLLKDRQRGFAYDEAPLFRLALFRAGPAEWRLLLSYHHLILDAWSLFVLLTESLEIYRALGTGEAPALEDPRSFRDYVGWLAAASREAARRYWADRLHGLSRPTVIGRVEDPGLFASSLEQHAEASLDLGPELTERLQIVGRTRRLTLNTLVQGAWALAVARQCRLDDICYGITITHRPVDLPGIESMVGIFINSLPMRVTVDRARPLDQWLHSIQEAQVGARAHDHMPLPLVQQDSAVPSDQPLFETLLIFENFPRGADWREKAGLLVRQERYIGWTNYPFAIEAMLEDRLFFQVKFDRAFFDPAQVERILRDFHEVLSRIASGDSLLVGDLVGELDARPADGARSLPRRGEVRLPGDSERVPPRSADERALAAIWAQVLGSELSDVNTRFLLLGGHSLAAMTVVSLGREQGFDLALKDLFGPDSTVAALARRRATG